MWEKWIRCPNHDCRESDLTPTHTNYGCTCPKESNDEYWETIYYSDKETEETEEKTEKKTEESEKKTEESEKKTEESEEETEEESSEESPMVALPPSSPICICDENRWGDKIGRCYFLPIIGTKYGKPIYGDIICKQCPLYPHCIKQ